MKSHPHAVASQHLLMRTGLLCLLRSKDVKCLWIAFHAHNDFGWILSHASKGHPLPLAKSVWLFWDRHWSCKFFPIGDLRPEFGTPDFRRLKVFGLRPCLLSQDSWRYLYRFLEYKICSHGRFVGTSDMLFSCFLSCNKHTGFIRSPVKEQWARQPGVFTNCRGVARLIIFCCHFGCHWPSNCLPALKKPLKRLGF